MKKVRRIWYRIYRLCFGENGDSNVTESLELPTSGISAQIVKEDFWQTSDAYGVDVLVRFQVIE